MTDRSPFPASLARRLLDEQRERDAALGGELFGDPGWNMLLYLFACSSDGEPVRTTTLCGASGAPVAAALRWIRLLEASRKVIRVPDVGAPEDPFVQLAPDTAARMSSLFSHWAERRGAGKGG